MDKDKFDHDNEIFEEDSRYDDDDYTDEDRSELEVELFRRQLIKELRPHFTN